MNAAVVTPQAATRIPVRAGGAGLKVQPAGRSVVARVDGPFDLDKATRLTTDLQGAGRGSRRVLLDLTRASYIDSTGVRALLQLHSSLDLAQREFRLVVRRGSSIKRTLGLLGLRGQLPIWSSVEGAWSTARVRC
jgi:anti-anti-sigma factor